MTNLVNTRRYHVILPHFQNLPQEPGSSVPHVFRTLEGLPLFLFSFFLQRLLPLTVTVELLALEVFKTLKVWLIQISFSIA